MKEEEAKEEGEASAAVAEMSVQLGKCGIEFPPGIHDAYQYIRGPKESSSKESCLTVLDPCICYSLSNSY